MHLLPIVLALFGRSLCFALPPSAFFSIYPVVIFRTMLFHFRSRSQAARQAAQQQVGKQEGAEMGLIHLPNLLVKVLIDN
jgi:hypothetical protein